MRFDLSESYPNSNLTSGPPYFEKYAYIEIEIYTYVVCVFVSWSNVRVVFAFNKNIQSDPHFDMDNGQ